MDLLVEIQQQINRTDIHPNNLDTLIKQLDSPSFSQWKRKYQRNEAKKRKQIQNKALRAQNKRQAAVLAKVVEEWSQQKANEAQLKKEESLKHKHRTKEELEERARKQALYKNKLKIIVKLEKLRLLRLNNSKPQASSNNILLESKIKELQHKTMYSINNFKEEIEEKTKNEEEEEGAENKIYEDVEDEISKFYSQGYSSVEALIHTRRSWDIYIAKENGYRIPQYFPSEFPLLKHSNWDSWLSKL